MGVSGMFFSVLQIIFLLVLLISNVEGDPLPANPVVVGIVRWGRDLDMALKESERSGKPVFVLFQEVPGCIGCRTFGSEVLSNLLLVEAIESEFLPVLVYNNREGGKDEKWLNAYDEPSWNFQVIRFLDAQGKDIIPRKDKIWTLGGVAARMAEVLVETGRPVPLYLQMIVQENDVENHGLAGFSLACFWTGEYKLGKIDGVLKTEAGWYDHREVTLVTYHKKMIGLKALIRRAGEEKCAQAAYLLTGETADRNRFPVKVLRLDDYNIAPAADQKKQLENRPELKSIPGLTPMQRTKVNSFSPDNRNLSIRWLSPRQLDYLHQFR
jgi:hypothetical protein